MTERFVATRTIAASPAKVFAVLTDPTRHQQTEPGDWVRDAITTAPIEGTGEMFAMNMFLDAAGGDYVVHNMVTEFERDKAIAWQPGNLDDEGRHNPGGWYWRYDLTPNGDGTDVALTYDWTATSQEFRDQVGGMPLFGPEYLEQSLASLERTVR
jgi:uncharacterized protein YndB with AHSA1/START domain